MNKILLAGASALAIVVSMASAQAADIQRRQAMPAKAPAYIEPVYNWTGAYVGINGGGDWGSSSFSGALPTGSFDTNGWLAGGTLGYNWQAGPVVFGIEGDIDWANNHGSGACAGLVCETRNDWLGTVRGRLGYAAGRFMPYVTGGAAFGNVKSSITGFGNTNATNVGWTVGGGIEAALAGPWTAKLEYLYVDLGDGDPIAGTTSDFRTSVVRVGLNYRF